MVEKSNVYPSVYLWGSSGTYFLQSQLLQIFGLCWIFISFVSDSLWKVHFLSFIYSTNTKTLFSKFSKVQSKQGSFRRQSCVTDFYWWFGECLPWVTAQLIRLILDIHFLESSLAILLLRTRPFVTFPWTLFPSFSFHLCTAQRRDVPLSRLSLKIKNSPHFLGRTIQCCLYCLTTMHILRPIFPQLKWLFNFFSFFQSKDIFLLRRTAPPDFNPLPHPHPNLLQDRWSV